MLALLFIVLASTQCGHTQISTVVNMSNLPVYIGYCSVNSSSLQWRVNDDYVGAHSSSHSFGDVSVDHVSPDIARVSVLLGNGRLGLAAVLVLPRSDNVMDINCVGNEGQRMTSTYLPEQPVNTTKNVTSASDEIHLVFQKENAVEFSDSRYSLHLFLLLSKNGTQLVGINGQTVGSFHSSDRPGEHNTFWNHSDPIFFWSEIVLLAVVQEWDILSLLLVVTQNITNNFTVTCNDLSLSTLETPTYFEPTSSSDGNSSFKNCEFKNTYKQVSF